MLNGDETAATVPTTNVANAAADNMTKGCRVQLKVLSATNVQRKIISHQSVEIIKQTSAAATAMSTNLKRDIYCH